MAGKEKGGFDNADAALFEGACYILTPTPSTPAAVVDGMKELAAQLGCARMTVTTPAHHDRMIAFTSQLPHVLAGAYVKSPCCLYHAGFSAGRLPGMFPASPPWMKRCGPSFFFSTRRLSAPKSTG